MQEGIEGFIFLFSYILKTFRNSRKTIKLASVLVIAITLSGCAAGQVMVASSEIDSADCEVLNNELGVAQTRLQELDSSVTAERDIRNFLLGIGGFAFPPLGVINAALLLTDSYAADYAETKALQNRYNQMVMASQSQGCSSAYALIPVEEDVVEPNA